MIYTPKARNHIRVPETGDITRGGKGSTQRGHQMERAQSTPSEIRAYYDGAVYLHRHVIGLPRRYLYTPVYHF